MVITSCLQQWVGEWGEQSEILSTGVDSVIKFLEVP